MIRVSLTFTLHIIVNHYFDASMFVRPVVLNASMFYCFLNWLLSYAFSLVLCTVISSTTLFAVRTSVFDVYLLFAFHRCLDCNYHRRTDRIRILVTRLIHNEFLHFIIRNVTARLRLRLKPIAPFVKGECGRYLRLPLYKEAS